MIEPLSPQMTAWFHARYGPPTPVQAATWARVAAGEHVLATAPTGSGKTLAAFLWPIDQLLTGAWPAGQLSVLYISPLKALGADIARNLQAPLEAMTQHVRRAGHAPVPLRVLLRTGDTSQADRQRMLRRPPEILATTPESLQLLLLSERGREMLASVRVIVLDEIHNVAASRRGTLLMAGVEQLADLAHEPQRLALSATVRPLERIARFVGGWLPDGKARPVAIVAPPAHKVLTLEVRDPAWTANAEPGAEGAWPAVMRTCREIAFGHRSTLFFTSSRRSAERLARLMAGEDVDAWVAAHHGSLSKEIRRSVEHRLARGELRAVVATSSLELGIDIGALDEVVLLGAPRSAAAAIQRVGRAGHQVGAPSHGTLLPLHAVDVLVAATLVPLVAAGQTEEIVPIAAPLDVLPQLILGLTLHVARSADAVFDFLRRVDAYRSLDRADFDRVVSMLRGRFGEARLPGLLPRLDLDAAGNLLARAGVRRLLSQSGGVIPDRGYFTARVSGSGAKLGELDEEFVWERRIGDEFSIGAQSWRVDRILDDAVEVSPGRGSRPMPPFWRAEDEAMPAALAAAVARLLQALDAAPAHAPLAWLDQGANERLADLVHRQKQATRGLPHAGRVVVEACPSVTQQVDGERVQSGQVVVHAPWGGMVLRPWGLALQAAAQVDRGEAWVVTTTDLCLGISAPCTPREVVEQLHRLTADRIEPLLRLTLGKSGLFGARFREAAGRALLLPRRSDKRIPLWLTRQRAKQMLQLVAELPEFPMVADVWRTCLTEWMDLTSLAHQLDRLHDGTIALDLVRSAQPSPLSHGLTWSAINTAMYEDDVPENRVPLGERAVRNAVTEGGMRVAPAILEALRGRLLRTLPGWAPADLPDARAWLHDHVLTDPATWRTLHRLARDAGADWPVDLAGEVAVIGDALARRDRAPELQATAAEPTRLAELTLELLAQHGPLRPEDLARLWQLTPDLLAAALESARQRCELLLRPLLQDDETLFWVLPDHAERLLRLTRAARRPQLAAMPLERWPAWRAQWQGLGAEAPARALGAERLEVALRPLMGLPLPAALWESDVLPARLPDYEPAWLDALASATDLIWLGSAGEKIAFLPRQALELFAEGMDSTPARALLADPFARYSVESLATRGQRAPAAVATELWQLAFAGAVTNDSLSALRQGLRVDFRPPRDPPRAKRLARMGQPSRLYPGAWQMLAPLAPSDALDAADRDRERVRQLADRHGVLCREALAHEPALLSWQRLLPTMRALELAGELVAGHFIQGIHGLQLALPRALDSLHTPPAPRPLWHAAPDPASACALDVPGLKGWLPARLAGSHLLWHGETLVAVVRRGGALLEPRVAADDSRLRACLAAFLSRTQRAQSGNHGWVVAKIGDEVAARSTYAPLLTELGFHAELTELAWRRWGG